MPLWGKGNTVKPDPMPVVCCGRGVFVVGVPLVSFGCDGSTAVRQESGAIVRCAECGRVWGVDGKGLFAPDARAVPPVWHAVDEQHAKQTELRVVESDKRRKPETGMGKILRELKS